MRAAWYERTGAPDEVLNVGELPDPQPGPGEVRVRLHAAGVNPADVKRRAGAGDRTMTDPRVIPGDDGAGVIDRVGAGVSAGRLAERVWVHSANHPSPFGTSAQHVVVPARNALELPAGVPTEVGACLGVPALTAHRCVFADGPVDGRTLLITGGAGNVAHYAIQLAKHAGATVIATTSTPHKQHAATDAGADHVIDYRHPDAPEQILELVGPGGIDRVIDVAFGANLPLTAAVTATNGTIVTYGSDAIPEPTLPLYPLMRRGITIRLVGVFLIPAAATQAATVDVTRLLTNDQLTHPIAARYPLGSIAAAHTAVQDGQQIGKILVTLETGLGRDDR